jgi:hypothetical protein
MFTAGTSSYQALTERIHCELLLQRPVQVEDASWGTGCARHERWMGPAATTNQGRSAGQISIETSRQQEEDEGKTSLEVVEGLHER